MTHGSRLRRTTALAALSLATVAAIPAVAGASTVSSAGGTVTVQAGVGEDNVILVSIDPGSDDVVVIDGAGATAMGPNCVQLGITEVRCDETGVTDLVVDAGDRRDSIENATALRASLSGGDGDDRLVSGRGADRLAGGDGSDTADYSARTNAVFLYAGFGGDNDGEAGERDDILIDVENLLGGDGNDDIGVAGRAGSILSGGPGDDFLDGQDGGDLLDGGPGRDFINGAGGIDTVDYGSRVNPVTVTLASAPSPTPDDGEAGEGDDVFNIERVYGGQGNDVLTGNDEANDLVGWDGDDTLTGNGGTDGLGGVRGNDTLIGGGGADTLNGGAGVDAYDAGEGDDLVIARDSLMETIGCGAGSDRAAVDAVDVLTGCEEISLPVEPDRDGDGLPNETDCAPDDASRPARGGLDANCDGVVDAAVALALRLTGTSQVAGDGTVSVKVACTTACSGTLSLVTAQKVRLTTRARAALLRLGSKRFALSAAGSATVKVKLSAKHRALLKRLKKLGVKATATATSPAGRRVTKALAFTVKAPKR